MGCKTFRDGVFDSKFSRGIFLVAAKEPSPRPSNQKIEKTRYQCRYKIIHSRLDLDVGDNASEIRKNSLQLRNKISKSSEL